MSKKTITLADAGTQTEARAIAERLTDYGLTLDPNVVICDRRVVDEAATALAAKDAELAAVKALIDGDNCADPDKIDALFRRAERAEAQLAEANKALEPFANVAEHDIGEDEDDSDTFWPMSNARYSMAGRLRVGHLRAARRAREAQGGE